MEVKHGHLEVKNGCAYCGHKRRRDLHKTRVWGPDLVWVCNSREDCNERSGLQDLFRPITSADYDGMMG